MNGIDEWYHIGVPAKGWRPDSADASAIAGPLKRFSIHEVGHAERQK